MTITPIKYMHRGKEIELFSPQGMVPDPPVDCVWRVGDDVLYTNDYGVTFGPRKVLGFTTEPTSWGGAVFIDTDCCWCPVPLDSLTHWVEEDAVGC